MILDSGTPARVTTAGSVATETGVTATFNAPADSWLYCSFLGNPSSGGQTPTFNAPTNTGTALTWTQVNSQNNASGGGVVVWRAYNVSLQTGITVTCTDVWSTAAFGNAGMWVDVWTGCNTSQTGAATAAYTTTAQTNNLGVSTTASGSRVVLVGMDWSAAGAPTSSDVIDAYTIPTNSSGGRAYKAVDSGPAGAVTVNWVGADALGAKTFVAFEILAPAAGGAANPDDNQTVEC